MNTNTCIFRYLYQQYLVLLTLAPLTYYYVQYIHGGEKTIALLGDGWWPQTAKQAEDEIGKLFPAYPNLPRCP